MTFAIFTVALLLALTGVHEAEDDGIARGAMDGPVAEAIFAGGCFWCMEPPFERLPGVLSVTSGYTGGAVSDPSYEEVSSGATGHVEAIRIVYDPTMIGYADLLEVYWKQIDPTDPDGQFVDRGEQYRSVIFYKDEAQRQAAEASKAMLAASGRHGQPVVTEILPASRFYVAEEHHQGYYQKQRVKYAFYRYRSGRDRYLDEVWGENRSTGSFHPDSPGLEMEERDGGPQPGTMERPRNGTEVAFVKPGDAELRQTLTPLQYDVTQREATESAFDNEFWNESREGIYVDIVSGEPLFSSRDKYESGTGWPSFTGTLEPANIVTRQDRKLFSARTEVRSLGADSHLGHLFDDGPEPGGARYCINSAALRFIPKERLEAQGYGEYLSLFEE